MQYSNVLSLGLIINPGSFNLLPNDKFLYSSKFKELADADSKINATEKNLGLYWEG